MKIKILYEDKNILAIEKPSGVSVHGDGRSKPARPQKGAGGEKTISDWVLENFPKMKKVGEPMFFNDEEIKRPGIVHRLDKETSGVLLLAKNQKAYEFLKDQFQNQKIKKTYLAIVEGYVKNDSGVINKAIGRSPSDFRRRLAGRGARGMMREAITEYKAVKRFEDSGYKFSFLEVYPKTGRTHQIRVHMKFFCHPIVCDSLYNPNGSPLKGLDRLALHAKSIEFRDLEGEKIKVESPIPKEFKKIVL